MVVSFSLERHMAASSHLTDLCSGYGWRYQSKVAALCTVRAE